MRALILIVALLALAGCATTQPAAPAAAYHQALETCKAQHGAHDYAAVDYCFAEARRGLEGRP